MPQQLHGCADRRQRIAELVRQNRQELVLPSIGFLQRRRRGLERRRALSDALLEFGVEPLERARLPIQLGEDADLGAQDLRHDRHRHVVHGAALVAAEAIEIRQQERRDEDDRRLLKARMLPDHRRQLIAVELRHAHVHQHDGDVVASRHRALRSPSSP